jgi:hypothetical protein
MVVNLAGPRAGAEDRVFPLVENGKPVAQVVAAGDDKTLQTAVEDLVAYVERISGARLAVTRGTDDLPGPTLHLGETALSAKSAAVRQNIKLDGFVLAPVGEDLVLAGNLPQGTANGIYTVLQDQFKVRWYWVGPLWEVVPTAKSLAIRITPNTSDGAHLNNPAFHGRLPWGQPPSPELARRMRLTQKGVKMPYVGTSHDLSSFINPEKYPDQPEYFAYFDGRRQLEHSVHPCFTHPDMFDIFMGHVRAGGTGFGVNDNCTACRCERCLKVDGQSPPYNGMWNFSESYFQLIARVAAQTAKEFPDRQLGVFAYQVTNSPPQTVEHIGQNVSVTLCQDTGQHFDAAYRDTDLRMSTEWTKKAGHVAFYDYVGISHWVPRYFPHILANQIRHIARAGVEGYGTHNGTMFDSSMPMWYVLYRLLWDPELDTDGLLAEMIGDLYGPAAGPIARFYEHWEQCWMRQPKGRWFWGMDNFRGEMQIYRWEDFEKGLALLKEAAALADSEPVRQRIAWLRERYDFTYASARVYTTSMEALQSVPTDDMDAAVRLSNAVADTWVQWSDALQAAQELPDTPVSGWMGKTGYVRVWGLKQQVRDAALAPLVRWVCAQEGRMEVEKLAFAERMLAGVALMNREQIEHRVRRVVMGTYRRPRAEALLAAGVPRTSSPPALDAPAADWADVPMVNAAPWIFLTRPQDAKIGPYEEPIRFDYIDPPERDELCARWQCKWDDQRLYLRVAARDEKHVQTQTPDRMWREDSLQVAFNPQRDNFELDVSSWDYIWGGHHRNEAEFGVALQDGRTVIHVWRSPPALSKGLKAEELITAHVALRGQEIVYELSVDWRLLPGFEPRAGRSFGIGLVVNDFDQEHLYTEYGGGVFKPRRPTEFAAMRLMEGSAPSSSPVP